MALVLFPNSCPENASAMALLKAGQSGKATLFRHASPKYNDLPLTGHDRNLSWDGESRQILVLRFLENLREFSFFVWMNLFNLEWELICRIDSSLLRFFPADNFLEIIERISFRLFLYRLKKNIYIYNRLFPRDDELIIFLHPPSYVSLLWSSQILFQRFRRSNRLDSVASLREREEQFVQARQFSKEIISKACTNSVAASRCKGNAVLRHRA